MFVLFQSCVDSVFPRARPRRALAYQEPPGRAGSLLAGMHSYSKLLVAHYRDQADIRDPSILDVLT